MYTGILIRVSTTAKRLFYWLTLPDCYIKVYRSLFKFVVLESHYQVRNHCSMTKSTVSIKILMFQVEYKTQRGSSRTPPPPNTPLVERKQIGLKHYGSCIHTMKLVPLKSNFLGLKRQVVASGVVYNLLKCKLVLLERQPSIHVATNTGSTVIFFT